MKIGHVGSVIPPSIVLPESTWMRNFIFGCKRKEKNGAWWPEAEDIQVEEREDKVYFPATSRSKKEVQDRRWGIALTKDSERLSMQSAIQGSGSKVRKSKILPIFPSSKMAASIHWSRADKKHQQGQLCLAESKNFKTTEAMAMVKYLSQNIFKQYMSKRMLAQKRTWVDFSWAHEKHLLEIPEGNGRVWPRSGEGCWKELRRHWNLELNVICTCS